MHDMVEAHPQLALLISPQLSSADYVETLARLYGFYRPLEEALFANSAWLPSILRSAPRWPRLQADLHWWGIDTAALTLATPPSLPVIDSAGAATGVAYVLEGAALGGRVIAQHVQQALSLVVPHGISFHAESNKPASHWHHVRAALDACPRDSHDTVVAAAASTYQSLHEWM